MSDAGPVAAVPVLHTERLILRAYQPGDAYAVHEEILGDPEVASGFVVIPPPTLDEARRGIDRTLNNWAREGFGIWAVTDASHGRLLGQCGLRRTDIVTDVELVYALGRRHWDQGYATEAARAALQFGFEVAGLDRVIAVVRPGNIRSQRVLARCGVGADGRMDMFGVDVLRYAISRR